MMRSLYSGISGLKNHQTRMDVIANNISNVNTIGYKASRTVFQDIFSQTSKSGMANIGIQGGTNPIQIGLGVKLSAIDVLHTPAPIARTDNPLDVMIEGDGYFIVQIEPGKFAYTRAGDFKIDDQGYLVTSHGYYVMGYTQDTKVEVQILASGFEYEFDPTAGPNGAYVQVIDPITTLPIGAQEYDKAGNPIWEYRLIGTARDGSSPPIPTGEIAISTSGNTLEALSKIRLRIENGPPIPPATIYENDFNSGFELTLAPTQMKDGTPWEYFTDGTDIYNVFKDLIGFSVADDGSVTVIVNNRKVTVAKLGLAMFSNPAGLEKAGNSLSREAPSSGRAQITGAVNNGAGKTLGGGLEMSNVDLATEFTDMIVTQRGFQANSRIITVSDTMLEELVNLKR